MKKLVIRFAILTINWTVMTYKIRKFFTDIGKKFWWFWCCLMDKIYDFYDDRSAFLTRTIGKLKGKKTNLQKKLA